jgi:CDP-ribitol ribitolphosphotransferase
VAETAIRSVQRQELELLRVLANRCEAEGIRWFALGGTLLGAAREGGFIPWDDDVDVGMPRPDYERFVASCRRDPDPRFAWHDAETDHAYPHAYGKMVGAAGPGDLGTDAACPPPFLDVFPIDGAPGCRVTRRAHAVALKLAVTALGARLRRRGPRRILALPFRAVPRRLSLGVLAIATRRYPFDQSSWAVNAAGAWGYARECQPRDRFVPTRTLPFEGMTLAVPGGWSAYLQAIYGDWRQPPEPADRRPRHLPGAPGGSHPGAGEIDPRTGSSRAPTRGRRPRRVARRVAAALGVAVVRAGFAAGRLRPPQPVVVLATRDPDQPGGNLVAIREALARRLPEVQVRLIGYRMRGGVQGRLATALDGFVVGYHLAAARLFIADDWLMPLYAAWPRAGTMRVQVWHAAGAFKRFGFSVLVEAPDGAEDIALLPMTANWDLCLVSSTAAAGPFADAFRLPRDRITSALGIPRADALCDPAARDRAADVRARAAVPTGRRVLLYAPTFRGETVRDARHPTDLDLATLRDALAGEWVLMLRLHPLVRAAVSGIDTLDGFVIDVSDWPDMNELLLAADVLVTDYSSTVFEFALLGRPIAVFAPDLEDYVTERGLYLDVRRDLPGPVCSTTDELAAFVAGGQFDLEAVRAFARTWFDVADGRATERFVDRVVIPAIRGHRPFVEPEPRPEDRVVTEPPA